MKKHGLTLLMLKEHAATPMAALKNVTSLTKCDLQLATQTAALFYKQTAAHPPSWVDLFRPHLGTALDRLYTSGTAAVLFVEQDGRLFAITFGYGKALLQNDCYEENFGLRVVLNSVDPEKLRSVDAQSLDAVPVNVRSQASVATSISEFGLDIEQDLIYAATGQPKDAALGKQITGKDAVKLSLPIDLNEVPSLLAKLMAQFSATAYKETFAWIDHLSEVRDHTLITELDTALADKIKQRNLSRTWLSIPDIIEWADIEGFKYQQPKRGKVLSDIGWSSYLSFLEPDAPLSVETFKKQSVLCISQSSGQPLHTWSVYRCIYCELDYADSAYALNNGKWYRVDADFLLSLNLLVKSIPFSTITLPEYIDPDEGSYNQRVHNSQPDYFALMDKKMIRYGGGSSQIEFCDLYTTDKHLVHVKRYGGASVLSHLFAQGLVSARLLLSDGTFRQKVNEKLPKTHRLLNAEKKPVANQFEVIYAIASNSTMDDFELPLFSKINLRNCYNQLQLIGMKVSLAVIPVTGTPVVKHD